MIPATFYQRLYEPLVSSLKVCHDSLYCGTETHKIIDIEAAPLIKRRNPFGLSLRNVRPEVFYFAN